MVRLLLVLAPAVSIMGGIGVSSFVRFFTKSLRACVLPQRKFINGKVIYLKDFEIIIYY